MQKVDKKMFSVFVTDVTALFLEFSTTFRRAVEHF